MRFIVWSFVMLWFPTARNMNVRLFKNRELLRTIRSSFVKGYLLHNFTCSNMKLLGIKENFKLNAEPANLIKRAEQLANKSNRIYDSVAALSDNEVTYFSTLKVLADLNCEFLTTYYYLIFPQYVSTDPSIRSASTEANKILDSCEIDLRSRSDVFKKLVVLENKGEAMKPEAERLLKHWILERKRDGLHLPDDDKQKVKEIKTKISELCSEFTKHLNNVSTKLEFSKEELAGLSMDFIQGLQQISDTGKYFVSLAYPDYFPVMRLCKNPDTRQQLYIAFNSRCKEENSNIVEEVRKLRQEHAELLGYPNHASYVHEILISKSPERVERFLNEVLTKFKSVYTEEIKKILELKQKECKELNLPFNNKINPWDTAYYYEKLEEIQCGINKEVLKEYFPLMKVTEGIFTIYQDLLGLNFIEIENPEVWHSDVRLFCVEDSKSKELLGYFYLDFFPRDGKYGHACIKELQPGCLLPDGSRQISVTSMVVNFTKPQANLPSLLHALEVITYFHEFGHVMHYICAQADFAYFSNTRVEMDFLEAPSQMLENWCYDKQCLKLMSSHYKTHDDVPQEMLQAYIKSRYANCWLYVRTAMLALYDLEFHSSNEGDVKELFRKLAKELLFIEMPEDINFACSFGHLFQKYDAQYYSYLWTMVYSVDMFETRFSGGNVLNPEVGSDYRKYILHPGASKDGTDMLRNFLGREPSSEVFYRTILQNLV